MQFFCEFLDNSILKNGVTAGNCLQFPEIAAKFRQSLTLSVTRKRVGANQPSVASITSHGTIERRRGAFRSRISLLVSNTLRDLFEQFSLFHFFSYGCSELKGIFTVPK